jgi:hypothetical protein
VSEKDHTSESHYDHNEDDRRDRVFEAFVVKELHEQEQEHRKEMLVLAEILEEVKHPSIVTGGRLRQIV